MCTPHVGVHIRERFLFTRSHHTHTHTHARTHTHTHTHTAIPCTSGTLRLHEGYSPRNGRLEICVNEVWATVCGTDFTDDMAGIACAAMGASDEGD